MDSSSLKSEKSFDQTPNTYVTRMEALSLSEKYSTCCKSKTTECHSAHQQLQLLENEERMLKIELEKIHILRNKQKNIVQNINELHNDICEKLIECKQLKALTIRKSEEETKKMNELLAAFNQLEVLDETQKELEIDIEKSLTVMAQREKVVEKLKKWDEETDKKWMDFDALQNVMDCNKSEMLTFSRMQKYVMQRKNRQMLEAAANTDKQKTATPNISVETLLDCGVRHSMPGTSRTCTDTEASSTSTDTAQATCGGEEDSSSTDICSNTQDMKSDEELRLEQSIFHRHHALLECHLCNIIFSKKKKFRKHMVTVHNYKY